MNSCLLEYTSESRLQRYVDALRKEGKFTTCEVGGGSSAKCRKRAKYAWNVQIGVTHSYYWACKEHARWVYQGIQASEGQVVEEVTI